MTENILFKTGREGSEVNKIFSCMFQHSLNGQKAMYRWREIMQRLEMPSRKTRSMNFLSNDDRQLDAALPLLIWDIWCSCWHTIGDRKDTFLRLHTNQKLIGESWYQHVQQSKYSHPGTTMCMWDNYLNVYCFFCCTESTSYHVQDWRKSTRNIQQSVGIRKNRTRN